MNSSRFAPAGLLIEVRSDRVMIDGGPRACPQKKINAWLVTDEHGGLIREIRELARPRGLEPVVAKYSSDALSIKPHAVIHTSHPSYGCVIHAVGAGAALMYLFDPDRGKRRRALIRNRAKHVNRIAADAAGKTQRDVRNRMAAPVST